MATLHLRVMGGFAAVLPAGQPVEVSGKKNRALLTYLALHADKKLTREKLISLLWSDRGEVQARSSLRQALAALRRDLVGIEPTPLTIDGDTVALDGSAVSTDVAAFEELAASASVEELRRAAKLYDGDLLDGLAVRDPTFDDWLSFERGRLREVAIGVLTRLMAHLNATEAITTGQRLVALDPLREASHQALMHAYAAQGQFEQAIRQHHYCRDTLRRELDVVPSAEMENLHREIREGRYLRQPATAEPEHGKWPAPASVKRRIAAIMVGEIVGYPCRMECAEERSAQRLGALISDKIALLDGRILNASADATLAEFPTAIGAVRCAFEIRSALAGEQDQDSEPLRMRFGIHL